MAREPMRRPRVSPDSDEEDTEERPSAEVKRVKLEKVKRERHAEGSASSSSSSTSEDEDEEEPIPDLDENDESGGEEDDFEEPEYGDEDLVAAYEAAKAHQKGYAGSVADAGVLKSISLVDFMCHRHLTVEFGPKMNFLVGHNGSGKSAVLTAIAVALGGKAMTTGRGQGLKDLIRKGADKAIITVVMANAGTEAFKPDVYDPYIVIERSIAANGSSSYKFRATKDGKTIANKRSELDDISKHFNINIDSPLTVLTQDQSRSFLQNADQGKLYKFFLNGTQLSTLLDTYNVASQNIEQLKNHIKRQQEAIPHLREKVESDKRKLEASRKILDQKAKMTHLLNQLCWAYVADKEKKRDETKHIIEEFDLKVEEAEVKMLRCEKKLPLLTEKLQQGGREAEQFNANQAPLKRAVADAKHMYDEARKEIRSMELETNDLREEIETDKRGLTNLERKIEAKMRLNEPALQAERTQLTDRRARVDALLNKLRTEKPIRQKEYEEKANQRHAASRELEDIQYQLREQESVTRQIQEKIGNLERQSVHRVSAFGAGIEPLMKEIARTRWRHSQPLGPLGLYVKLEDMRYRDAIQSILGGTLCCFAVRDPQDRATLMDMLKRHARNGYRPGSGSNALPPVFMHSGDLFDFSRGDLSTYGETILSKLRFENEEVLRLLITMSNIERVFLAPTLVEANRQMDRLLTDDIVPGCQFYAADGMTTSGNKRAKQSGPYPQWRGNTLFAKDLKADVERAKETLREANMKRDEIQATERQAKEKIVALNNELNGLTARISAINKGFEPAERDLENIRRRLAEMASSDLETTESLRDELVRKIEHAEENLRKYVADMEAKKAALADRIKEIEARQKEVDEFGEKAAVKVGEIQKIAQDIEKERANRAHYEKSKQSYEEKREQQQAVLNEHEKNLEDWTTQARNFCPTRVETRHKPEVIERERGVLDKSIKDAERALGFDSTQLTIEYKARKKQLHDVESNLKSLVIMHRVLTKAMNTRKQWWSETRSHTALRARTAFVVFENLRDLDGRLEFDHDKERLSLVVHSTTRTQSQDGTTQKSHYKTPKNLSGGERSFSTVSLLLALWSTVPCPIRALDEWDVFLDAANRKVAASMLMNGAKESDGKQFILITPQDMAGIDVSGPDKKVIRMADPTRNQ
ncbi:hypothetical protein CI109_103038 [Kwoniella shandongensis]|uniref:RecF/RecN/SMC N-terminal domain-containing protein n=1 Tax=Kwoniella shandongensis TaxID=1734106 RepID=A0AAJ8LJU3_9TREE